MNLNFTSVVYMCAAEGEEDDEKLLEEYYLKFKGPSEDKKYHLIPKFYSKVNERRISLYVYM